MSWSEFMRQMQECEANGDHERAHGEADNLLLEALRFLRTSGDSVSEEDIEQFISAYENVGRWYA